MLCAADYHYCGSTPATYISIPAFGIILGTLQGFVLRQVIDPSIRWVVATGLCTILALFPFIIFFLFIANIGGGRQPHDSVLKAAAIAGSLMGLIIGSAQWLVLRKIVKNGRHWVFLNILGYPLGLTAFIWVGDPSVSFLDWLNPILFRSQQGIVFATIAMLIPALFTGFFLSWLSEKPANTSPPLSQPPNP